MEIFPNLQVKRKTFKSLCKNRQKMFDSEKNMTNLNKNPSLRLKKRINERKKKVLKLDKSKSLNLILYQKINAEIIEIQSQVNSANINSIKSIVKKVKYTCKSLDFFFSIWVFIIMNLCISV